MCPDEPVWPASAGGAVSSVFGRTGAVAAAGGDYSARQIMAAEGGVGVPVCTNANPPGQNGLQDGTNVGGTTRVQCYAVRKGYGVRLLFAGFYAANPSDVNGHQPMIIAASVEDNSGNIFPATFGGQHYGTVAKDGLLISDVIGIDFNAGDKLWLRTYYRLPNTTLSNGGPLALPAATIPTAGLNGSQGAQPAPPFDPNGGQVTVTNTVPALQTITYTGIDATGHLTGCTGGTGSVTDGATITAKVPAMAFASLGGEACALAAAAPLDQTLGGVVTQAGGTNFAMTPLAVLSAGPRQPCVLGVGDSYFTGLNDAGSRNNGVLRRALIPGVNTGGSPETTATNAAPGIGHLIIALAQDKAQTFAVAANRWRRMKLAQFCTHAVENYGTNDLNSGRTLAQLQADKLSIWTALASRGLLVYTVTLPPRTTSTDSWATTANQTPIAGTGAGSHRTNFNDWLRAGAPIDPATLAAVAVGTAGALLAGTAPHPLTGFFEMADALESARNSGFWAVNGTANWMTADGVHPSSAVGYPAAAATITRATFT